MSEDSKDAGQPAPEAGDTHNWAVAIVHGLGDTEPLSMMRQVGEALTTVRPGLRFDDRNTVYEWQDNTDGVSTWELQHSRRATLPDGKSVQFATAHWSEISRLGDSFLDMLGGMIVSGFGVRFLADAGSEVSQGGALIATMLRFVLKAMIFVLAVFLPLTVFTLIFSAMGLLAFYLIHDKILHLQIPMIVLSSLVISLLLTIYGVRALWPQRKVQTLMIPMFLLLMGFALLGGGLMWFGHVRGSISGPIATGIVDLLQQYAKSIHNDNWLDRIRLLDETAIYFAFFQFLQYLVGIILILLTVAAIVLLVLEIVLGAITGQARWMRIRSLGLATISVITLWVLVLLILSVENIITSSAMTLYANNKVDIDKFTIVQFSLTQWPWTETTVNAEAFAKLYPVLWFEIVLFGFLIIAFLIVVGLGVLRQVFVMFHLRCNLQKFAVEPGNAHPVKSYWPRLIVAWPYSILVLLFMATISVVAVGLPFFTGFRHEVAIPADLVRIGAIVSIIFFILTATWVRSSAELMLDVVNHFVGSRKNGFPIRERIDARLVNAVERLITDNDKPHLVIISHSQGTVITLDTLFGWEGNEGIWMSPAEGWSKSLSESVSSLTILTFGSPLTHIYQRYFPLSYPDFSHTMAAKAASDPRVKWFNTYRIDDYIGTYIENSVSGFPTNVPAPIGGHTKYWTRDVFEHLFSTPGMDRVLAYDGMPVIDVTPKARRFSRRKA